MMRLDEEKLPFIPTPEMLYTFFRASVQQEVGQQYDTYASTSITSGGMVLPREDGEALPFAEGMKLNEQYSVGLMRVVIEDNPDVVSELMHVNPVFVGKVPLYHYENYGHTKVIDRYYGQDDYLYYWFPVILGLEAPSGEGEKDEGHWQRTLEAMQTLTTVHRHICAEDVVSMNDRTMGREAKAKAYQHFTEVFFALSEHMVHTDELSMHPVKHLVGLIDNRRSLGGNAEEILALLAGITSLRPTLANGDWSDTPLSEIAEELTRRKASFATPAGKVALSLAGKPERQDMNITLSPEHRSMIETSPNDRRTQLEAELRDQLGKAILGGEEGERDSLLKAITGIASALSRDRRHLFHRAVIKEVLNPGTVNMYDDELWSEGHAIDQRARQTVLAMRDPYAMSH